VTIVKHTTISSSAAVTFTCGDQTFTPDGQAQTITDVPPGPAVREAAGCASDRPAPGVGTFGPAEAPAPVSTIEVRTPFA
jgi:hypothetical protein